MENLDNLYQWLDDEGVFLFDRQLPFSSRESNAVTIQLDAHRDVWGIFLDKGRLGTASEEKSALLHESGHYATGATHQVSSPFDLVQKHEYKANKWAVERAFSQDELDDAVAEGCIDIYSLADHFNVTIDFMRLALCWHIYGNLSVKDYMPFS